MEKKKTIKFGFLPDGVQYKLTLIADGVHDKDFKTQYLVVSKSSSAEVILLRRGSFAAFLIPIH
ncbi:MAG: glycoside hydrolase family 97 C-terminal domain-containing protein [Sediminibacterium sp.]